MAPRSEEESSDDEDDSDLSDDEDGGGKNRKVVFEDASDDDSDGDGMPALVVSMFCKVECDISLLTLIFFLCGLTPKIHGCFMFYPP